jgi:pyridoxal phosphate enzyme (YggS family)
MWGVLIMDISRNIRDVQRRITAAALKAGRDPNEITLIAVTKGLPPQAIEAAIAAGICNIGENRVQETKDKITQISAAGVRPTWHMIGHLQRNKVKTAVEIFDIIHSIDSLRLAEEINSKAPHILPVLLQVNVSSEETKGGFAVAELPEALRYIRAMSNLEARGLMTIAPFVSDPEKVRPVFRKLREMRDSLDLKHLSMGMTDDFEIAIEEGATMVRIGRAIFGG